MGRRTFSREFKLEAVRLVKWRSACQLNGATSSLSNSGLKFRFALTVDVQAFRT